MRPVEWRECGKAIKLTGGSLNMFVKFEITKGAILVRFRQKMTVCRLWLFWCKIETIPCGNFKAYGVRAEREALEKRTNRRAVVYRCFRNYLLLKLQIAGSFVRQFFTGATCSRTLAQHDTGSILITFYQHSSSSISQIFNIQSHTSVYRCFELILYWLLVAAAQSRSRVWY